MAAKSNHMYMYRCCQVDGELVMGGINHYNGTTYWVEQVLMHVDVVCCGFGSHF